VKHPSRLRLRRQLPVCVRDADRSVADDHLDWFKARSRCRASLAITIIQTKYRTVEGTHDARSIQHHEFTGTGIEGQGEVRAAIDIRFDFRARPMDKKGKCIGAFAVADLLAKAIRKILDSTKDLTCGWCEVM
jgi:hypothetical protein